MHTDLHRRIKARCRISKRGEEHWILTGAAIMRIPELGNDAFTTKRVSYAAFIGPIGAGVEVYSACGMDQCIKPWHMGLRPARTASARALALPDEVEALSKPEKFHRPKDPVIFPKGLTKQKFHIIKLMAARSSLSQIRDETGVAIVDIVKIKNGVYDVAASNLGRNNLRGKVAKASRQEKLVNKPPADVSQEPFSGPASPKEPENISDEEAQWLRSVGRG